MRFLTIIFSIFLLTNNCFADRCIAPMRHGSQEEIYIQGGKALLSNGGNSSVMMFNTTPKLTNRRGNFYFSLANHAEHPSHFLVHQLAASDQWGRRVRIVPKQELIRAKQSQKNWKLFASAIVTGLQSMQAEKAGEVKYQSHTDTRVDTSIRNRYPGGYEYTDIHQRAHSSTRATAHCEALRQQAYREVGQDAANRRSRIIADYDLWNHGLTNFYLDSHTLFPGDVYGVNFQIEVPKEIEKELEYLIFTYEFAGDKHAFSFYCGNPYTMRSRRNI